jgi:hypothetical protein
MFCRHMAENFPENTDENIIQVVLAMINAVSPSFCFKPYLWFCYVTEDPASLASQNGASYYGVFVNKPLWLYIAVS